MITAWITIGSVEFYVALAVVAAAIVALCVKPAGRGEARQYLLPGTLCGCAEPQTMTADDEAGWVDISCNDDGTVALTRRGLRGMNASGALSLAITVIGFDVTIEERVAEPREAGEPTDMALFTLDFMGRERYHVKYNSEATGSFVSFSLNNRPGLAFSRRLGK